MKMGLDEARSIAGLFTTATLRSLAAPAPWEAMRRLGTYPHIFEADIALGDLFDQMFAGLARTRPSEYVFKNTIVSRLIFGRHRPTTAGAMLEMPIGRSVADVVVVNGTITMYEIKTDLDSFARLDDQLADYSTLADNVYVVTSKSRSNAALRAAPSHIGVLSVDNRGRLSACREAAGGLHRVTAASMFGSLRQAERIEVLRRLRAHDDRTDHSALREMFDSVPVADLYPEVVRSLRARLMAPSDLVSAQQFPHSLRALAYGAELNPSARARLATRLKGIPRDLLTVP
jgi:hypothetical protein